MLIREREQVEIPTPSGPMRTVVFRPAGGGRYPGIVFYSEIFQVTAPIARTAAFLAGHGYAVAVPEVYHEYLPPGTVLAYDSAGAEKGNALKTAKALSAYDADARAALDFLKAQSYCTGRLGALGICLGGHLSFRAAMNPGVRAGACFYATDIHKRGLGQGLHDDSLDRMKEIRGELLLVWGRQDPHIPQEGRALLYQALAAAGANFTWHEFNGQHAFLRDEGLRYDPANAHLCHALLLDLYHRRLGEGEPA